MAQAEPLNTSPDTFSIGRRQVYILPTKIGWYYALILIALFAIAVKFDNQAAFMMLFILVGLGNAVMFATHRNIIGLQIDKGSPIACYAGADGVARITLTNPTKRARKAVYVSAADHHTLIDLQPNESQQIKVLVSAPNRGVQKMPPIVLSSQYPAGLFFCWTKQSFFTQTLTVYPKVKNLVENNLSSDSGQNDAEFGASRLQQGDFHGLRNYQDGDRLRDIHWPSFAKNQKLVTKQYESLGISNLSFSWTDMPKTLNHEDKLSQLSYWLTNAERAGGRYSLNMPTVAIPTNEGPAHLHACLSVLAEFEAEENANSNAKPVSTKSKLKHSALSLFGRRQRTEKMFKFARKSKSKG